jgi:hypothetical protein
MFRSKVHVSSLYVLQQFEVFYKCTLSPINSQDFRNSKVILLHSNGHQDAADLMKATLAIMG